MLTLGLLKLMQQEVLPVGWKHWTIQTLRRKALRLVGKVTKKRAAAHLAGSGLTFSDRASPGGEAPDLPVGLTGAGPAGDLEKSQGGKRDELLGEVRPLSLNLARAIELDGNNVVVIDTDPQRTAKMWAESKPEGYGLTVRHESESDASTLEKRIKRLSADADFAVNGAAKIEGATGAAVRASHAVLVPVQPTPTDTWRRGQLWKL